MVSLYPFNPKEDEEEYLNSITMQNLARQVEEELGEEEIQKLIEEYDSGRYGELWTRDRKYCIYCDEFGNHEIEDCPELVSVCLDCGMDEHPGEKCPIKEPSNDDDEKYVTDEDGNIIPVDPYEACFSIETGELLTCKCKPQRDYACFKCRVGRKWPSHAWRPYRNDAEYDVAKRKKKNKKGKGIPQRPKPNTNQNSKVKEWNALDEYYESFDKKGTKTTKYGGGYGYDDWDFWVSDRHYGDTYTTYDGTLTFHVSSSWNLRKENEYTPQFGLYFDWGWKPWWRAEHIDWPDMSLPSHWEVAFEQILAATEKAQNGVDVEFGCIGAHGRTGTALAVVNVILGADPITAIDHVRDHHCKHAIETSKQEWYVYWVHSQLYGSDLPPMPTSVYDYKQKSSGVINSTPKSPTTSANVHTRFGGLGTCSQSGHFNMWLDTEPGKGNFCPRSGKGCTWWDQDIDKFMKGEFPSYFAAAPSGRPQLKTSTIVDGFIVPKTGHKEIRHNIGAKKGCNCDVCRYRAAGFGAFLRPVKDTEGGKEWDTEMNNLERKAVQALGNRRVEAEKEARKAAKTAPNKISVTYNEDEEGEEWINVAQHDGSIFRMRIAKEFKSKPPKTDPATSLKHGDRRADYVYLEGQGWVWEGIAKVEV